MSKIEIPKDFKEKIRASKALTSSREATQTEAFAIDKSPSLCEGLLSMASLRGFEPPTYRLGGGRS
ncbi:MAG: hypothetical protein J1F28_10715, partial [Oscillospiraceae bacterium]|nr:hypothetical protein [Oscillospiraceae bacterium]